MSDSLSDTVRCAVAQHLHTVPGSIRPNDRLERDLGLYAVDIVLIAFRLEEIENVELPMEELEAAQKVGDLTALLRAAIANDNHLAMAVGETWRRRRPRRPKPVLRCYNGGG